MLLPSLQQTSLESQRRSELAPMAGTSSATAAVAVATSFTWAAITATRSFLSPSLVTRNPQFAAHNSLLATHYSYLDSSNEHKFWAELARVSKAKQS